MAKSLYKLTRNGETVAMFSMPGKATDLSAVNGILPARGLKLERVSGEEISHFPDAKAAAQALKYIPTVKDSPVEVAVQSPVVSA